MRLYRVLPYLSNAADDEPGGVLFLPPGGKNRADAPDGSYRCLYVSDAAEGAIAEAFGRFDFWDDALLTADPATPLLPGSRFVLATYELDDTSPVRSLDDAQALLDERLRPSDVVTRNRDVTQNWSMRIHARGTYAGVSWWSYYDAGWNSFALWDITGLTIAAAPQLLSTEHIAVQRAAATIVRRLIA